MSTVTPRVSALVPIYNAERFLRGLLEDLEAQTLADRLEIVICDTGSPQNERAIVAEYQVHYSNIVYLRTEHRENSHAALNRCLQAATGPYVTLACADDRHRPDALERLADTLDQHPDVGLVYADSLITGGINETFARNTAHSVFCWPEFSLRQLLQYSCFGPQPMWRKSLHRTESGFDSSLEIAGDYELFLRLAWKAGAYHLPEVLGLFLEGGNAERNAVQCQQETQQILQRYRSLIPLEDLYPGLQRYPADPPARVAALTDFGNSILASGCPDALQARTLYQQALALLPNHPLLQNNLGLLYCLSGERRQGMDLLERAGRAGDSSALRNLAELRRPNPSLNRLLLAPFPHPVLENLPPLLPPDATRRAVTREEGRGKREEKKREEGRGKREESKGRGAGECAGRADVATAHSASGAERGPAPGEENTCISESRSPLSLPSSLFPLPSGLTFVVITAGRRPQLLELVIRSIQAQSIPDYEILVVGKHAEGPGYCYLPAEAEAAACRRGAMRNRGMRAARYRHIMFLDDDCLLAPNWYAAFQQVPPDFAVLTQAIRLPDGTRYWDRVMMHNGVHRFLLDEEDSPYVYASSGAMLISAQVAHAVAWDENMREGEDVDFSRRCQQQGFSLTHAPNCLVYHADATYTSIGRWTLRRTEGKTHLWVDTLKELSPVDLSIQGETELIRERTAEAVDCFRYGLLHYPDYTPFAYGLASIENRTGGPLPGSTWYPEGDPVYLAALARYQGREEGRGTGQKYPNHEPRTTNHESLNTRISSFSDLIQSARRLSNPNRLLLGDYAREANALLYALETAGANLHASFAVATKEDITLPAAVEGRFLALSRQSLPPDSFHLHTTLAGESLSPLLPLPPSPRIARIWCDSDTLPSGWAEACRRMDALWVPNTFSRELFVRAGVEPEKLAVVPSPLVMAHYPLDVPPLRPEGARGFNFLACIDWRRSEGWDSLLRAYVQEFTLAEDVALILRVRSAFGYTLPQITQMVIGCVKQVLRGDTARMPTILLDDSPVPVENMPNLYRAADCYVLPSYGEGCGRRAMEAMAMALPVIAVNQGGCSDFLTQENGFPVCAQWTEVPESALREMPALRGLRWAEPNCESLRQALRTAYCTPERTRSLGQCARADIAAYADHARVGTILREALNRFPTSGQERGAPSVCAELLLE